jgi:hypothetical protein
MFGQKFTNTNEMLQCKILHYAKSAPPKSADLNTAVEYNGTSEVMDSNGKKRRMG